ncbi:MAG: hypothetical protein ACI85O_003375 [Saprospiraceae bacterium]|jgi:hypothetical protein
MKHFAKISIAVTMLLMTFTASNLHWGSQRWLDIAESDAQGYYSYLPAIFIYQDLNFGFFEEIEGENGKYYESHNFYDYRNEFEGEKLNKYFIGTAVVEAPFFLIAHFLTYLIGGETDGFSALYMISISVAALFYLWLGLYFLNRLLKTYNISEANRGITLFACVFGTNLFCYSGVEPGMSHVFSFGLISSFLYYAKCFSQQPENKHLIRLSALLGMIILIRPTNVLVLLVLPFIAGNFNNLRVGLHFLLSRYKTLLISSLIVLGTISTQLIYYKLATGNFFVYSYNKEGFDFSNPHFFDILFSYRKGLFLYTPLYLLSLSGLYFLWKKSFWKVMTWLSFFVAITYIFSSWHMWFYGGSFSSRVYVEYLPLFMILLAIYLEGLTGKIWKKRTFVGLIFGLILLCQFQTFQYRHYKIHWSDMTKEMYWDVFLKVDKYWTLDKRY